MYKHSITSTWISRWNSSGTHSGLLKALTATTSYGLDKGAQYGIRFIVSSDGQYVLAYAPYYYYGAGSNVCLIRVSDGKFVWDTNAESSNSYFYMPIGKSGFACVKNINCDSGTGITHQHISAPEIMNTIADNAQANLCRTFTNQLMSNNFYSTDYPLIIPLVYDTSLFNLGS